MKKRFDKNPRKRFQSSHDRFRVPNSDAKSEMMSMKRVRLKDPEKGANHPLCRGFDACSVPCEATEVPRSSSDPKTSEFAFFKKLKKNASRPSGLQQVDRESTDMNKFRLSSNLGESDDAKNKETKPPFYVKGSGPREFSSSMPLKDAAFKSSDITSRIQEDHERPKSSFLIKTPTTIDLDSFLSRTPNVLAKPGAESQLKDDGDIFLHKRLKLQKRIAKTYFPESEELPKECHVVSLLLRRLLPANSENTLSESPNVRPEFKDKFQLHPLPDSIIGHKENWESLMKSEDAQFLVSGVSAAWPHKFMERFPCSQRVEGMDPSAVACAGRMLLGYKEGNELDSSLDDIGSKHWSNRFRDRALVTQSNKDYDNCTESWFNRHGDRNMVKWNEDHDYVKPCNGSTNIFKNEGHVGFPYDSTSSRQPCRFGDQRDWISDGSYGSFAANDYKRTALKYKEERFYSDLDNSARHVSFPRSGSLVVHHFRDYAEPDFLNDVEIRREPPLLLCSGTDESDTQIIADASDMQLDSFVWREDDQNNAKDDTWTGIHSASVPCNSALHLSRQSYQDYHLQRHLFGDQKVHLLSGSSCAPFASFDQEQREPDDSGFFKNIFRDGNFFFLPQVNHCSMENIEKDHPSLEALLFQGTNSDTRLYGKSVAGFSEKLCDISADNILQLLRQETQPSQFLLGKVNDLVDSRPEDWCLTSLHTRNTREVQFPLQLPGPRWMDTEQEAWDNVRW